MRPGSPKQTVRRDGRRWVAPPAVPAAVVGAVSLFVLATVLVGEPPSASQTEGADGHGSALELYQAGLAHFRRGDMKQAMQAFEQVSTNAAGDLGLCATNMVGQVARLEGDLGTAQKAFGSVIEQARQLRESGAAGELTARAELLEQLAGIYQAEIFEEQGRWDQAAAAYQRLIDTYDADPQRDTGGLVYDPRLWERLARLYWRVGEFAKARETFERLLLAWPKYERAPLIVLAVQACPDQGGVLNAAVQRRFGSLGSPVDDALSGARPAGAAATGTRLAHRFGETLARQVASLAKQAGGQSPWFGMLQVRCGVLLFKLGQLEQAEKAFAAARAAGAGKGDPLLGPAGQCADLWLALVHYRQGRLTESLDQAQAIRESGTGHVGEFARQLADAAARTIAMSEKTASQPSPSEE